MPKQLTEDELNLRRKARRRLVGAIVLTLAVVVILPMVLDSEPKPVRQDIELRIPNPDKVGQFVPGVAVSEVVAQSSPPVAPAIAEMPAVAVSEQPPPANQTVVQDKETPIASSTQIEAPEKVQPVTAKAVETKSADKPLNAETYTVQIGAYSNPDTAKQEWKKLKDKGFKAYTEKTGDKIRVRVGPYAEREKAEKVRLMLEKHGLHPNIITLK